VNDVLLPEGIILPQSTCASIVPQRVRPILLKDGHGIDHIAQRGVHGGSVRRHDEPVDHDVVPRPLIGHEVAAQQGVERPRPDDIVALWPHGHGVQAVEKCRVPLPMSVEEGGDAGVHPGVEDVLAADEPPPAQGAAVHGGLVHCGIDVAVLLFGRDDISAVLALPNRYGGGEEPLPRDDPVPLQALHPVL